MPTCTSLGYVHIRSAILLTICISNFGGSKNAENILEFDLVGDCCSFFGFCFFVESVTAPAFGASLASSMVSLFPLNS